MKFRTLQEIAALVTAPATPSMRTLYEIWQQRQFSADPKSAKPADLPAALEWLKQDVSLSISFVNCALKREECLLVSDAGREALSYWQSQQHVDPRSLWELGQGFARAESRTGQSAEALPTLETWVRDAPSFWFN